jgi:hypothetical protein
MENDRQADLTFMGTGGVTSRNVEHHNVIKRQEVEEAVNKLMNEKAAEEDGIDNEMLKGGPEVVK